MLKNPSTRLLIIISNIALVLGVLMFLSLPQPRLPDIGGFILQPPKSLPEFQLISDEGQPLGPNDLYGRWQFLFFGYTFCPDICPLTLLDFSKVQNLLAEQGFNEIGYRFISVDPLRDTPERLKEYVRYSNPIFRGATGTPEEINRLTRAVGAVYTIHEPEPGKDFYLVDHSATVMILNPRGELAAVFSPPHDPETVAQEFIALQRFHRQQYGFVRRFFQRFL